MFGVELYANTTPSAVNFFYEYLLSHVVMPFNKATSYFEQFDTFL
jgi:hypothetical protein